jgi:predicted TIM-barrel fold metal-dependent hydrolase
MLASWRENIRLVAGQENISLKIGGLGFPWFVPEEIGSTLTDSDLLASYWQEEVDFAIEAFGPDRVMFESNFPVDCRVADYVTLWNAMKKLARGYSVAEREKMFRTNAQAIYKLT